MTESLSPLTIGLAVAGVVVVIVTMASVLGRAVRTRDPRPEPARSSLNLPQGADAALWSIIEAVPDPRNHLALTRDLSGEVRLAPGDRDLAAALFADRTGQPEPVIELREGRGEPAPRRSVAGAATRTGALEARQVPDASDLVETERRAEPGEDLDLTAQIFFAGEPRLTRF